MRDGFHPEYHDERFFDDDGLDDETIPAHAPRRNGRRPLGRATGALRGLRFRLLAWPLAAIGVATLVYAWSGPSDTAPPNVQPAFQHALTFENSPVVPTLDIPVPVPPGWPELPVTVERPFPYWGGSAAIPASDALAAPEPAPVPAPPGWTTLPIDGQAIERRLDRALIRALRVPAFEAMADEPSVGAKVTSYEIAHGQRRPFDVLGGWLGAPTGAIKAQAPEWGEPRSLPLALYTIDADGVVADALPATTEWMWLAWAAFLAWGASCLTAWLASYDDHPWGLPWASYESGTGRFAGNFAAFATTAWFVGHTGSPLYLTVFAATLLSFGAGRAARARRLTVALGAGAAYLALTTPFVEPIPALAGEYGALGVRAWDMLVLGAVAAFGLLLAIPWPSRSTNVTIQERSHPLVQDVRVVDRR